MKCTRNSIIANLNFAENIVVCLYRLQELRLLQFSLLDNAVKIVCGFAKIAFFKIKEAAKVFPIAVVFNSSQQMALTEVYIVIC